MDIHTNIPLKNYLTMKIGGAARFMTDVFSIEDVQAIVTNAKKQNLPFYVIGGGSNVIAHDETYNGIIIRNRIKGFTPLAEDSSSVTIKLGAGENWDEIVAKTVENNLSGIEALSAIPGTCGAAPVQNIGAYGQEIADVLVELEAFDTQTQTLQVFSNDDCQFSYRHSRFRGEDYGRYIITSITIKLYKSLPKPPFYNALQSYFDENHITIYNVQIVRDSVMAIRKNKLPDPAEKPNAGSFFKNAIIDEWLINEIKQNYAHIPHYDMGNKKVKVPTGWLIEQCDFKGKLLHGIRVNPKNALVFINESANSYEDLRRARDEIVAKIRDTFRITIEQEPLEIANKNNT